MTEFPPEIPEKQDPESSSNWRALFLTRAQQNTFALLWGLVILVLGFCFVMQRGFRPIDIDHAEFRETRFIVDINSAQEYKFSCLPGIGKKTAQAIIDYREENGDFTSVEAMVEVPGVSQRLLNSVKHFLQVNHATKFDATDER